MWERERSMREELISVIIPTYNRRDKVTYAVKSVLDQTYRQCRRIEFLSDQKFGRIGRCGSSDD